MIHPLIWEDPSFNKLSRDARLLFIGMISNADDEGYIRGDAGSLKRLVFGFDYLEVKEIENWRKELELVNNIHFYKLGNEEYAHFLKWKTYQKQQKDRIQATTYPLCSKCVAGVKQVRKEVSRGSRGSKKGKTINF